MLEAANKKGFTLPARPYEDLSASMRSTKSNFDENQIELMEINEEIEEEEETEKEMEVEIKDSSFWGRLKRIFHFLLETKEYKDPETFGWRIKFRRIFLTLGTIAFSYQTIQTVISTQNYSSKREIQNILDYLGNFIYTFFPDFQFCPFFGSIILQSSSFFFFFTIFSILFCFQFLQIR